jgi:hypothetical protein
MRGDVMRPWTAVGLVLFSALAVGCGSDSGTGAERTSLDNGFTLTGRWQGEHEGGTYQLEFDPRPGLGTDVKIKVSGVPPGVDESWGGCKVDYSKQPVEVKTGFEKTGRLAVEFLDKDRIRVVSPVSYNSMRRDFQIPALTLTRVNKD